MRHRFVVVIILIAIGIAFIPSAAHQLTSLRNGAGHSSKTGIWNVFLKYHA